MAHDHAASDPLLLGAHCLDAGGIPMAARRAGGGGVQAWATTHLKARAGPIIAVGELTVQRNDLYSYANDLDWYWDPTDQVDARANLVDRAGMQIGRDVFLGKIDLGFEMRERGHEAGAPMLVEVSQLA